VILEIDVEERAVLSDGSAEAGSEEVADEEVAGLSALIVEEAVGGQRAIAMFVEGGSVEFVGAGARDGR